jgi:hypothetical protein
MKPAVIRVGLAGAAAIILASAVVSPALAATARTLPAGDSLYAVSCYGAFPDGQLLSVDASSAVSTTIGSGTAGSAACYNQPAWDAATTTAYVLTYNNIEYVDEVNLTTGAITTGPVVTLNGDDEAPDALAISPTGQAFITENTNLYSVNLTTGALTLIGSTGHGDIYGLAFDPETGILYGVDYNGVLYTINTSTAVTATLATLDLTPGNNEYSLQVASDGILWVENDGSGNGFDEADLWSVDPSAATIAASAIESGLLSTAATGQYYSESLLLVPSSYTAPTIVSSSNTTVTARSEFSFTFTATGTPAPTFTVTMGTLPAGVALNPTTGVLSGTPAAAGTSRFTIAATNAAGTATQAFTLTIAAVPAPVVVVHLPIVSG